MNTSTHPTTFDEGTPEDLQRVLEGLRAERARVRVFYGDQETGRDWGEEFHTIGYVGRSTGSQPILLLVHNRRSYGGGALLTARILKITRADNPRAVLYRHPKYQTPEYETRWINPGEKVGTSDPYVMGYRVGVWRDGENVANFKTEEQARRYIAFMRGERNTK